MEKLKVLKKRWGRIFIQAGKEVWKGRIGGIFIQAGKELLTEKIVGNDIQKEKWIIKGKDGRNIYLDRKGGDIRTGKELLYQTTSMENLKQINKYTVYSTVNTVQYSVQCTVQCKQKDRIKEA